MEPDFTQTILCPVDFSELSADALREAVLLATCGKSRVVAMHASWFEAPPYFTEAQWQQLQDQLQESLAGGRRFLESFVTTTLGANAAEVEKVVVEGVAADRILAQAAKTNAGLIVMGTHGRSGWNRWTLGSVAERVLRESSVPVLTVRGKPPEHIRHILCPVNDTGASRIALSRAASLAACFDATVTALHVHDPHGGGSISDLCSWVPADARARCAVRELALRGNAAEEIVRLTMEGSYDLLVLAAPRRRFFEGMVLGTTVARAVRHAACPVLSVPAADHPLPG